MPHTRATNGHLSPRPGDKLMTNLRSPLMTVVEDTYGGSHDTLIAACDPQRYRELGVEKWEEHGSCAENLVLALKELNERNGLKGAKAIGADVTVNVVPAPLNLFMNIPWNDKGDVTFEEPNGKKGGFVRLKAERDCVVVMSACPQDVLAINGHKPMVAHFVVEEPEKDTEESKPAAASPSSKKKTAPKLQQRSSSVQQQKAQAVKKAEEGKGESDEVKEADKKMEDSAKQRGEEPSKKEEEALKKEEQAPNKKEAEAPKKEEQAPKKEEQAPKKEEQAPKKKE
ncbi:hypothetical protein LTS18_003434, partial [Coniosporium uncinatum]